MSWPGEDWLLLSGLQHFAFCRRQWALIRIEDQWAENYRTVDGHLMHERVHDQKFRESRGDRLTVRGLAIPSARLGISGQCDAVAFFKDPAGRKRPRQIAKQCVNYGQAVSHHSLRCFLQTDSPVKGKWREFGGIFVKII